MSENNIRFFEGTSIPLPNGDVILVINDRTERIEAKRVLRNMDKIQQEVLVDLPLSVMLFTKNSEIVLTNDYILKHIGKSAHDVINTKAQDSLGKSLSALSYDVVKKVVKTGESIDSGIVNIKKGPLAGQHWLVFGRPLHSRKYNVNGVLVISIDRTDSVKLNEERVRFAEAVHQSQKIEALNDFAGSLAHELSNLLHPVAAYARLLAKTPDDQKRAEYASKINKGTMAAGDILKRTLTMARTDKSEAKHCNIYDITHETITTAKDLAPASLSYDFHSSQTEVIGFAQEGELRQVLLNLLNNAAEAMAYKGRIKIKIETNQPEPASVKLRNPQQTRFIKISVIDQGPGFSSKIKSRLFDPFFTTK
ncbi:MAG: ATP-binding protein, partial [Pseudomonadota bacterium]